MATFRHHAVYVHLFLTVLSVALVKSGPPGIAALVGLFFLAGAVLTAISGFLWLCAQDAGDGKGLLAHVLLAALQFMAVLPGLS